MLYRSRTGELFDLLAEVLLRCWTEIGSDRGKERERERRGKLEKQREFFPFFSASRCLRKWRMVQHSADLYLNLPRSLDRIPGWFRFGAGTRVPFFFFFFFSLRSPNLATFLRTGRKRGRAGKRFKIFKRNETQNRWSAGKLAQTLALLINPGTSRLESTSPSHLGSERLNISCFHDSTIWQVSCPGSSFAVWWNHCVCSVKASDCQSRLVLFCFFVFLWRKMGSIVQ